MNLSEKNKTIVRLIFDTLLIATIIVTAILGKNERYSWSYCNYYDSDWVYCLEYVQVIHTFYSGYNGASIFFFLCIPFVVLIVPFDVLTIFLKKKKLFQLLSIFCHVPAATFSMLMLFMCFGTGFGSIGVLGIILSSLVFVDLLLAAILYRGEGLS